MLSGSRMKGEMQGGGMAVRFTQSNCCIIVQSNVSIEHCISCNLIYQCTTKKFDGALLKYFNDFIALLDTGIKNTEIGITELIYLLILAYENNTFDCDTSVVKQPTKG